MYSTLFQLWLVLKRFINKTDDDDSKIRGCAYAQTTVRTFSPAICSRSEATILLTGENSNMEALSRGLVSIPTPFERKVGSMLDSNKPTISGLLLNSCTQGLLTTDSKIAYVGFNLSSLELFFNLSNLIFRPINSY